jgi:hypothetical protein
VEKRKRENKKILRLIKSFAGKVKRLFFSIHPKKAGKKLLKKAENVIKTLFEIVMKIADKLREKFSINSSGSYKLTHMAKGYVDTKEKIGAASGKRGRKKRKKYKDMNNIEKIRFLYEKKVTGAVKKGIEIEKSLTPNETGERMVERKYMKENGMELIKRYNAARYDDAAEIADEMVERVRGV